MKSALLLLGFFFSHLFPGQQPAQRTNRAILPLAAATNHTPLLPADSLDTQIGQLIIFGFYGTKTNKNDAVYKAVKEGKVGSILLYRRNVSNKNTADSLRKLVRGFQTIAPIPLLVSIDQEGGLVNRFDKLPGFPEMPSPYAVARKNDIGATKFYSDNIAYTLSRMGINLNYAPVLDVHNPGCPVLGARERCFSADPAVIAQQAAQVIASHDYFKVGTVAKHFPGHGSSSTDSHLGITDVSRTWQWKELEPYKTLIDSGLLDAVMTAHIINDKLDPSRKPATLSKPIITGLLRDSLGFKGVIFTDDMLMQAISKQYGLEESIRLALEAGVDMLMFSNNIPGVKDYTPDNIHAIIKKLVISGKISRERIAESYGRVMALKEKWAAGLKNY
jgi:beta-N-acetylhexosaminidase